ncbi:peptidoglycan-binding domain-containing protein [Lysobacter yananisis]|uniref:Peptidoglycan-binding domain-containing protein n=1 Tax=Lysobacter yananisis TaxID=1003114 RepID=A0ABY9PEP2_9GAMM|nr:peptidoglycan-binding domain-containing protein [Lysobacter yananisis]WMT05354.1 peptidoglycan-binding domain-containing protein [Lysobacter yananisis]
MDDGEGTPYRVEQLGPPRGRAGLQVNEPVADFDGLATHHPGDNRRARLQNGLVVDGQSGRLHAFISGEIQEIEMARGGRDFQGLKPDQVLLKKDFLLEDSTEPRGAGRDVDVPSPMDGYVQRVSRSQGLVDIYDRKDGDLIARVRHMSKIPDLEGKQVVYGQTLGQQDDVATKGKHVHLEMDTRYYRQFENYLADLTEGRFKLEPEHRVDIRPRAVVDDGALRLGESSSRIRDVQEHLNRLGHIGADGDPLEVDGVYRLNMQRAVLDYQREQCVPQTGDIDRHMLQGIPAKAPPTFDPALEGISPQEAPFAPMPHPFGAGADDRPCAPPTPRQIEEAGERRRPLDPVFSATSSPGMSDALVQSLRERLPRAFSVQGAVPADADMDRIAVRLAVECRRQGIERPDHVVVGNPAADGSGRHVFAVVGDLADPANRRVDVAGQAAARTAVEESLGKLEEIKAPMFDIAQETAVQELQKSPLVRG